MKDLESRLHKMMEQVEQAKEQLAQYKGERKQVVQQLAQLGVKAPEQAKKILHKLDEEIAADRQKLDRILSFLETKYEW